MSYQRIDRISEEVRREVDLIIRGELHDPRIKGTYSITRADVTRDLRYAKIYISILEQDDRAPIDSVCHRAGEQTEHEVRQNRPSSRERGEKRRPTDVEHQNRHCHSGDGRTGHGNRASREEQSKRSVPKHMWLRFDGSRRRGLAHVCTLLYLLLSVAIFRTVAS